MIKLAIFDLDDTLMDTTNQLGLSLDNLPNIKPFNGAKKVLYELRQKNIHLPLVSFGNPEVQVQKLKLLDELEMFDYVDVHESLPEKQTAFARVLQKCGIADRKDALVVGNRIDAEIEYGNRLGCTTVHLRHGKYKNLEPRNAFQFPKHTILL